MRGIPGRGPSAGGLTGLSAEAPALSALPSLCCVQAGTVGALSLLCFRRLADELSGWVQRHQRGRRKIPQRAQERQVGRARAGSRKAHWKTKCPRDFCGGLRDHLGKLRGGCEVASASRGRLSFPFAFTLFTFLDTSPSRSLSCGSHLQLRQSPPNLLGPQRGELMGVLVCH